MKCTWISNIKRHGKHSSLATNKTCHGWQHKWLQWHHALCNCTFLHGIKSFQICEGWATWEGDVALPTNAMSRRFLDDWNSCINVEIVMTHAWCRVCALYEICSQWCGRRRKEFHVCHHCEKLAIAFGLINTNLSIPFQIRKNLWVCEDCHTSTNVHLKK